MALAAPNFLTAESSSTGSGRRGRRALPPAGAGLSSGENMVRTALVGSGSMLSQSEASAGSASSASSPPRPLPYGSFLRTRHLGLGSRRHVPA